MTEQLLKIPSPPIQQNVVGETNKRKNHLKIILFVVLGLILAAVIGIAGYVYLTTKLSNAALGKSCLKDSDCVLVTQKKECCAHPQAVNQKELTNNKQIIEYPFLLEMMLPRYPWCSLVKCKEYNVSNPKAVCQNNKCAVVSASKPNKNKTKFTCPQNGWVDCMPIMNEAKILACSSEAEAWYKINCPNFQGFAQ